MSEHILLEHLNTIDSTNAELKRRILATGNRVLLAIRADSQTAGRGRRGRSWLNTDGALLMSIAMPADSFDRDDIPLVSFAAALAVCNALAMTCGADLTSACGIKWPNDIELGRRKAAGILSELVCNASGLPHVVIGIGVNVNADVMPDGVPRTATSLKLFLGRTTDRAALADSLIECVERNMRLLASEGGERIIKMYAEKCTTLNQEITVRPNGEATYCAFAEGLEQTGRLIVRMVAGERRALDSADVSVRRTTI